MSQTKAPTLDRYLNESYEVIRYVHDHLPEIRAIAARLTPVEDLVEFQAQIELLYARLALLVEASQIIIQITDAGFAMITARDAAAQRALLGLGSAALRSENFFAKEEEFQQLKAVVEEMLLSIEAILHRLDTFATKEDLEALKQVIEGKIGELADQVGSEIIENQEVTFEGETYVGLARAFEALYARITLLADGLMAEAGKILILQTRLANHDRTLEAISLVQEELLSRTKITEDGLESLGVRTTTIETSVEDVEKGLYGEGGIVDQLRSEVIIQGQRILSESERTTLLTGRIEDARANIQAQASALAGMRTRLESAEGSVTVLSEDSVQLGARLDDTEQGLVAQGEASDELRTLITQTNDDLTIVSENVTNVRASLGGTSNMLANSGFEGTLTGWTVFLRGTGWTTGEMELDMDAASMIPDDTHALGVKVTGVPSGEFGIRSPRVAVEQLKNYIFSGYIAARNCTVRLEWRAFNQAGGTVEFGTLGSATGGGGKRISDWKRVFDNVPVSMDVTHVELQMRISNASGGTPRAWLLRPMVEQVSAMQNAPSPWTPGSVGIGSLMAEANQELRALIEETEGKLTALSELVTELETLIDEGTVSAEAFEALRARVEQTEEGILSITEDMTQLTSRLGAVVDWVLYVDPATATNSYLQQLGETTSRAVQRGLTLIRFGSAGQVQSAQLFDIFTGAAQRNAFVQAVAQVPSSQYVLVIGQPNLGVKTENVIDAMNSLGAQFFDSAPSTRAYALLGRGGLGKGGGVEVIQRDLDTNLTWTFTLVNGVPRAIAERYGQAEAYNRLFTQITETADDLELLSGEVTQVGSTLTGFVEATNLVTDQLSTRIQENAQGLVTAAQRSSTIEASLGGSANLISNSDFSSEFDGWTFHAASAGSTHGLRPIGDAWSLNDDVSRTAALTQNNGNTTSPAWTDLHSASVAVDDTKTYQVSVYVGAHRTAGRLFVYYHNATGGSLGNSATDWLTGEPTISVGQQSGGRALSNYKRIWQNIKPPAGTARVTVVLRKNPTISGSDSHLFFTRFQLTEVPASNNAPVPWQPSARDAAATGRTVSLLDQKVTQQGQSITSQGQSIQQINNDLAGKASASALNALSNTVSQQGNTLTSQSQSIQQINNDLSGKASTTALNQLSNTVSQVAGVASAASEAVTSISANLTGSGNMLANTEFVSNAVWELSGGPFQNVVFGAGAGAQWQPIGVNTLMFNNPFASGNRYVQQYVRGIRADQDYIASTYVQAHRAAAYLQVLFLDGNGTHFHTINSNTYDVGNGTGPGGTVFQNWPRLYLKFRPPAGTVSVIFRLIATNHGYSTPHVWFMRPMLEAVSTAQTQPSPWAAGGAETARVVQSMTANVGPGGAYAQATMMTDVNGRLVGTRTTNNGSEGIIDFIADKVRFTSPNGGMRTEYSDGNWRAYGSSGNLRVRWGVW